MATEAVATVTIENPVINSPFEVPQRHFRVTAEKKMNGCEVHVHDI